jgi:RNA recognition motif-containing protein
MPRAFQRNLKHLKLTKGHYSAIKKRLSLYQYSGKRTNFCRYAESFWVRSWKNAQLKNCTVWKSNLKRAFTASGEERLVIPPSHFRAYNVVRDGRLSFIFDLTCQTQLLEEQVSKLRAKVSQSSPTCCPTVTLKKIRAFGSKLTLCSVNFLRHHKPGADTAQEQ